MAGLDDKSAVRVAGVRVGKVDGITLRPDGTAVVHLALDPGVELREGASAQIRSLGLLGDKYVELQRGRPGRAPPRPGALLEGAATGGFDDITKMATDIGKDLKELSSALAGSMGGKQGEEKLNRIVDNVGALAEALREMVEQNRGNIDTTLTNLKEFSTQMRETLARMDRILEENRGNLKSTVANADEISEKLKTTADNLNSITGKIDTGQGTIGKLLNDDETHKNLNDALTSVKTGVESLNQTLSRVNRLQLDLGFRAEYASPATATASTTSRWTRSRATTSSTVSRSGRPRRACARTSTRRTTVTFPNGSQQTIHTTGERYVDQLLLSLQLGYRLKDTILRAGLIESRGGAAVEQTFRADTFRVAGEVWDFSRDNYRGHVKLYGRWNASPNLYMTGGVDDLLNPGLRVPFIGGGIRWKDEDLKALLGSIPIPK